MFATIGGNFFTIVILSYLSFALLLLFRKSTSGPSVLWRKFHRAFNFAGYLGHIPRYLFGSYGLRYSNHKPKRAGVAEAKVAFGTSILGLGNALFYGVSKPLVTSVQ